MANLENLSQAAAGKQNERKAKKNLLKPHLKLLSVKTLFVLMFPQGQTEEKAVLMKIHQIFKLKPIINVYSCHWRREGKGFSLFHQQMLQKDTIKIFIEISPFFGVKTSKTFKTYNDIQVDS